MSLKFDTQTTFFRKQLVHFLKESLSRSCLVLCMLYLLRFSLSSRELLDAWLAIMGLQW